MPEVVGRRVNSGLSSGIAEHGGQPGAPSSLPYMAGGTELLRQAASLKIEFSAGEDGQTQLTVWVSNSGAGHYLPTGVDDLRQLWLAVTVADARGEIIWQSGQPDAAAYSRPTRCCLPRVHPRLSREARHVPHLLMECHCSSERAPGRALGTWGMFGCRRSEEQARTLPSRHAGTGRHSPFLG